MELRVLQYFLAVAKEQNISAAAQSLHLTQPTLSRQLRELEEELGKELMIRAAGRLPLPRMVCCCGSGPKRSWSW